MIDHILDRPASVMAMLRDVAQEIVLPKFCTLSRSEVREKGPGDLVTVVDEACEAALSRLLTNQLPGSAVLGEEQAAKNPKVLERLYEPAPVWVIDPLDGTRNFTQNNPRFAMIVALVWGGETRAGWILDPVADKAVWAVEGKGAWEEGQRLSVSNEHAIEHMRGSVGWGVQKAIKKRRWQGAMQIPARMVRLGSVGIEYMELARGEMDFAEYGRKLKPWDHAAGVLIHREAGGVARRGPSATDYHPDPGNPETPLLLANSEASWSLLRQMFDAS